jgi:hypothetical protein
MAKCSRATFTSIRWIRLLTWRKVSETKFPLFQVRSAERGIRESRIPLTPALSPRERENRQALWAKFRFQPNSTPWIRSFVRIFGSLRFERIH